METKGAASKAAKDTNVDIDTQMQEKMGVGREQLGELLKAVTEASSNVSVNMGRQAAADFLAQAKPELESRTEEIANKAVSEALARKQKASTMKTYGIQAAVSAAVFAIGTATLVGVDKFRHRNDAKANAMNPQYTGPQ